MSRRLVVALVGCVVITGALAAGGLVVFIGEAPGGFRVPPRSRSDVPPGPPSTSQAASGQSFTDDETPWARISDAASTKAQYFAALNDPARSDLQPDVARRLSALGADFVRADVSGDGRARFGDYWGGATDAGCCRDVVVYAASAERHLGRDDLVDVAVIWSADRVGGGEVPETTTVVHFLRRGDAWQPLHPWDLA